MTSSGGPAEDEAGEGTPLSGLIRLLATVIAGRILEAREGVFLVSEDTGTAPEPTNPAPVQGNEKKTASSAQDEPDD